MARKSVNGINVPKNILDKADSIMKMANLKHRSDAFNFMGKIQPIILGEKTIRLPKSKSILKQIDVRYFFEDKK